MVIRDLDHILQSQNISQTAELSVLKGTRIGIDGFHWLKTHVFANVKEPLHLATGGRPLTMFDSVKRELDNFKKFNIKPFFVFNGVTVIRRDMPKRQNTWERENKKKTLYDQYEARGYDSAKELFGSFDIPIQEYLNDLFEYFTQNKVDFMRAPYLAWGELCQLSMPFNQVVHTVYGANELLLFNINHMILEMDFASGTFRYVNRTDINSKLTVMPTTQVTQMNNIRTHVSRRTFLDICILAGSFLNSKFDLPLLPIDPVVKRTQLSSYSTMFCRIGALLNEICSVHGVPESNAGMYALYNMWGRIEHYNQEVQHKYGGFTAQAQQHMIEIPPPEKIAEDQARFFEMQQLVLYHVIFNQQAGRCEPIWDRPPLPMNFSRTIIGPQMPIHVYFLLSQGIISPYVLNGITSRVYYEAAPMMDSLECRFASQMLMDIRTQTQTLLMNELNPDFSHSGPIYYNYWHGEEQYEMESSDPEVTLEESGWNWSIGEFQRKKSLLPVQQPTPPVDLHTIVNWKLKVTPVPHGDAPQQPQQQQLSVRSRAYTDVAQLEAIIQLRFLELLGYFRPDTKLPEFNHWGKALSSAKLYPEESLMVLELCRYACLHGDAFNTVFPGEAKSEVQPDIALISRVLSLLPVVTKSGQAWQAPVQRDLAMFSSIAKNFTRTYRSLIETILLILYMRKKCVSISTRDIAELSQRLPFYLERGNYMGIVARFALEKLSSPADLDQTFNASFPALDNAKDQLLKKALPFWDQTVAMVRELSSAASRQGTTVDQDDQETIMRVSQAFESANSRMQAWRKQVGI